MTNTIWPDCQERLSRELSPEQFSAWIMPLRCEQHEKGLSIFAPNRYVFDIVSRNYLDQIREISRKISDNPDYSVQVMVGDRNIQPPGEDTHSPRETSITNRILRSNTQSSINPRFTFDTFVVGKSNEFARAAGIQVGQNPGKTYNPLFVYGGVGLGKTHLLHAIGNMIVNQNNNFQVAYLHSETFVAEMVKSLQHGTINEFKRRYRSANALLIDDVQFFADKERTQEEFFHTFNTLLEAQHQIILTSDRYPKELPIEDRLRSRFSWGLTVEINPPDYETRIAILRNKAKELFGLNLEQEVTDFVANHVHSNVRELEGALRRIVANAEFTGKPITLEFARESLKDLIAVNDRLITIQNIQKTVSDYFGIKFSEMASKRRSRTVARPRQVAMALAKELTMHSYPEIGQAFGGRDHTTVMYAVNKIKDLRETESRLEEDYQKLLRTLSI